MMMRLWNRIAALFAFAVMATTLPAQITSPDKLIAPPPRTPALRAPDPTDDLQWMWAFAASGDRQALLDDRRFQQLLDNNLRAPQAFWSAPGSPLADAARAFLSGPGMVAAEGNRRLVVSGCVVDVEPDQRAPRCSAHRGFFLVDFGGKVPLTLFAALRWNEQSRAPGDAAAPYTLWLFPSRPLEAERIPSAIRASLAQWLAATPCQAGTITSVILVDPNGVPHILGALDAVDTTDVCRTPQLKAIQP